MKYRDLAFFLICVLWSIGSGFAEDSLPKRIVSLSPVVTEELFLLGAGERVVGRTHYCTKPPEAKTIEEVGNVLEISMEKIVALHPDLVVVTSMTNPRIKEKLKQFAIPVEEFPAATGFQGLCDSFLRLGKIVGKEKEAQSMVTTAQKEVEMLRQRPRVSSTPSVFLQVGADPLVTMIRNSFLDDLIVFSGGINMAHEAKRQLYSREKVLESNPDIIIIVSMGFDGEKEKKIWQGYPALKAVQKGAIYTVDSDLYCAPTPLTFVTALKSMIQLLHPDEEASLRAVKTAKQSQHEIATPPAEARDDR